MEMQIKQGALFVRVMTGEITDVNIIPHRNQSPCGGKKSVPLPVSPQRLLHLIFPKG